MWDLIAKLSTSQVATSLVARRTSHNLNDSPENVQRFRGGLVFKAHGLLYHSTLSLRVIKKKKKKKKIRQPRSSSRTPCSRVPAV